MSNFKICKQLLMSQMAVSNEKAGSLLYKRAFMDEPLPNLVR
ncbi:hypothetical protein JOC37_001961 [Desulfohalotomaculum tongense]|nr:hypothetical protein [Desulforadius tongensis]